MNFLLRWGLLSTLTAPAQSVNLCSHSQFLILPRIGLTGQKPQLANEQIAGEFREK
jgi:hypothetical protein